MLIIINNLQEDASGIPKLPFRSNSRQRKGMMRRMQLLITSTCKRLSALGLGAFMVVLAACGGKETKKVSQPAPQALAPAPQPQEPAKAKTAEPSEPAQAQ